MTDITEPLVEIGIFKASRSEAVGTPFASHVPEDFWEILTRAGELCTYEPGAILYRSGAPSDGIYLIQTGEVSFRFAARKDKKQKLLKNAGPGAILGLGEALSGEPQNLTAEAVTAAQVSYVTRPQLMEFMRTTPLACMQAVQLLSDDLHRLYHTLRQQTSRAQAKKNAAISR